MTTATMGRLQRIGSVFRMEIDSRTMFIMLAIIGLNMVDAFCTIRHLSYGAVEFNPLMDALLQQSTERFVVVKHLLASVCLIIIAMHGNIKPAKMALLVILPLYSTLALYHVAMFLVF